MRKRAGAQCGVTNVESRKGAPGVWGIPASR